MKILSEERKFELEIQCIRKNKMEQYKVESKTSERSLASLSEFRNIDPTKLVPSFEETSVT